MSPAAASILGWISYLGAAVALVVYVAVLLRRPQWVRLMNGSGLFFSGLALTQLPTLLNRADVFGGVAFAVAVLGVMLLLAVVAQATAALRNRQAWDGVDRRAGGAPASGAVPAVDRRGVERRTGRSDPSFEVNDRREAERRGSQPATISDPAAPDELPASSASVVELRKLRGEQIGGSAAAGPPVARGDRRDGDRRSAEPDPLFEVNDRREADRRSTARGPRTAASAPRARGADRRSGEPDPSFDVNDRREGARRDTPDGGE